MRDKSTFIRMILLSSCLILTMIEHQTLAQKLGELESLPSDQTRERELSGAEIHRYAIDLSMNEFFQVRVEQNGVDVELKLLDPNGHEVAIMDSPNAKEGPEVLSFVATIKGRHTLAVAALEPKADKGKYTIRLEPSRLATVKDRKRVEVEHLFMEGMVAKNSEGQAEVAVKKFDAALEGWLELREPLLAQYCLDWLADNARAAGDGQKALSYMNIGLQLAKTVDNKLLQAQWLNEIGYLQAKLGDKRKAIENYQQGLALAPETGDLRVALVENMVTAYGELGDNQNALSYMNIGLQLAKKVDNKRSQAQWLNEIGYLQAKLGDRPKAIESYQQGLALAPEAGDVRVALLNNIAVNYGELGDNQKALEFQRQALDIIKKLGNKQYEGVILLNIGTLYESLNEKQKALETYDQALTIANEIDDAQLKAQVLTQFGGANFRDGNYQNALGYFNKALPFRKTAGDKPGEAETLMSIGNVYLSLGDDDKALDQLMQALAVVRGTEDKVRQISVLVSLGNIELDLNRASEAIKYFDEGLQIAKATGDKYRAGQASNGLALGYEKLGQIEKALESHKESLRLAEEINDKSSKASSQMNLAEYYVALGETGKATEYFQKALLTEQEVGEKGDEAIFLSNLMHFFYRKGQRRPAIFYGKLSINVYQNLRQNIEGLDKETQKRYLKAVGSTYRTLAQLLILEGRLAEAQQVLNSFKDQQFFDPGQSQTRRLTPAMFSERESRLASEYGNQGARVRVASTKSSEAINAIGYRLPSVEEANQLEGLRANLNAASNEFLAVLARAETEFSKPADEKDRVTTVPDLAEMEDALRTTSAATKQRTVAIYTLVGEETFDVLLITPDAITSASTLIKEADLNAKIIQFYGTLQSPEYETRTLGKQLYDIILKPIEAELEKAQAQTLIWELDGSLRYVPMAALSPDGKSYLVEKYQNVVFTRADKERMTRPVSRNWSGTGFGSSQPHTVDLPGDGNKIEFAGIPGVTAELDSIFRSTNKSKGIVDGVVFEDAKFTKGTFYQEMSQKRPLVHISSHFAFRPGDDNRSFLLLGDGNALTLSEMKQKERLFDGVELLTLSACNTAATLQDANGREIDGFAELAQRLGAGAVMATLWSVSDKSTPWLMRDFYAIRQGESGVTKAEALRLAQLALLHGDAKLGPANTTADRSGSVQIVVTPDGKRDSENTRAGLVFVATKDAPLIKKDEKKPFAHPYYWSPFVLFGNWR